MQYMISSRLTVIPIIIVSDSLVHLNSGVKLTSYAQLEKESARAGTSGSIRIIRFSLAVAARTHAKALQNPRREAPFELRNFEAKRTAQRPFDKRLRHRHHRKDVARLR